MYLNDLLYFLQRDSFTVATNFKKVSFLYFVHFNSKIIFKPTKLCFHRSEVQYFVSAGIFHSFEFLEGNILKLIGDITN